MNNSPSTQAHLRLFNKVNKLLKREQATADEVLTAFSIGMAQSAVEVGLSVESFIDVIELCWDHFRDGIDVEKESGSKVPEDFFGVYCRMHEATGGAGRSGGVRPVLCDVHSSTE